MINLTVYAVRPGDTLFLIARRFGVDAGAIAQANDLGSQPYLVTGQALVIPTAERSYMVQAGDSVYSIARRFGVTPQAIIELNGLSAPYLLNIGQTLRIPEERKNYGTIETNAYIEPTIPNPTAAANEAGPYLTYISPFSYTVNADGSLNPIDDTAILTAARQHNVAPFMVITNFSGGNFSTATVDTILKDPKIQKTLIDNTLQTLRTKGYYGLNIDFERISPENREAYNSFLRRVMDVMKPLNIPVSVALAPKTSPTETGAWHGAHDYAAIGGIVDFVILMTYEWGWSGGPPYAVSPIDQVEDVIEYAISVMPPDKIMMSLPLYGYDWTLPYMPGGRWATRLSPQDAVSLAAREGAQIQYDEKTQSPYFNYYDGRGIQHVVWFDDARSVREKLLLVNKYGLRGVSFWVLGEEFPQVWQIMDNMFNIVKVV